MIQLRVFQPLSINLIHFDNDNWNTENNNVLFRVVHRYIHATKRFSNIDSLFEAHLITCLDMKIPILDDQIKHSILKLKGS